MDQLTASVKAYIEELIFSGEEENPGKDWRKDKFYHQKGRLRQALHRCSLGSEKDRLFVREFIKEIVSEPLGLSERDLFHLLPAEQEYNLLSGMLSLEDLNRD